MSYNTRGAAPTTANTRQTPHTHKQTQHRPGGSHSGPLIMNRSVSSNAWQQQQHQQQHQHQQQPASNVWPAPPPSNAGWDYAPSYAHNLAVPTVPRGLPMQDDERRFEAVGGSPGSAKQSTFGSDSSPLAGHSTSSLLSSSYESSGVNTSVEDATMAFSRLSVGGGEDSLRQKPNPPQLVLHSHHSAAPHHPMQPYSPFGAYYPSRDFMDYSYPYSPVRPDAYHHGQQEQQVYYSPATATAPPSAAFFYGGAGYAMPPTPLSAHATPNALAERAPAPRLNGAGVVGPGLTFAGSPLFPTSRQNHHGQQQNYRPVGGIPVQNIQNVSNAGSNAMYRRDASATRDANAAVRSAVLTEFKNNKTRKWELKDILGHCIEFSGDQHGSRFIQQKMEVATVEERNIVFQEVVPTGNGLQLMQDVFGNYVIQKLFEYGSQHQRALLAGTMKGRILQLSLDMYGCRVVQKAVECLLPDQQASLVRELDGHILRCVRDANGNHVVQKMLERVIGERLTFVRAFSGSVLDLSTHPYGCRVLQRCFEYASAEQCRPLLDELRGYYTTLAKDQFGNYVVQFVLENGAEDDRNYIVSLMNGNMLDMAKHKFASNVCEKAIVMATPDGRHDLVEEILSVGSDGVSGVETMMKDQFANYVLQRALKVVEGEQLNALVALVCPQLVGMRNNPSTFSKHLNAIERLLREKGIRVQSPEDLSGSDSSTPTS